MHNDSTPKIGILRWEAGLVTKGLQQLAKMKGNSVNPDSYAYPVLLRRVKGASAQTIIIQPDENVLNGMVAEMKEMISAGVKAITTTCGFNAIHQKRLANLADVPVFTSSIMQVPFVKMMLGSDQSVAILTARKKSLTIEHLRNAGIGPDIPLHVFGMEGCQEWGKLLNYSEVEMDLKMVKEEIISMSMHAIRNYPEIGAFVLECTDMPPFSEAIKKATGLPVFDFITMTNYVYKAL